MVIKKSVTMIETLNTRGYGAWGGWSGKGGGPERLPGRGREAPYERAGADWVLALVAVVFLAGQVAVEAIRLRG